MTQTASHRVSETVSWNVWTVWKSNDSSEFRFGRNLLFCAIGLWFLLMIPAWRGGPLVLDEHVSVWIAEGGEFPSTLLDRSLNIAATPPLSSLIDAVVLQWIGHREWALRSQSAIATLLTIVVIFQTSLLFQSPVAGGMAGILLMMHPEVLDEIRIARSYGLVLLLSSLVIFFTLWWSRELDRRAHITERTSPGTLLRIGLGWMFCSIALTWTHYTSVLMVICSSLWILIRTLYWQSKCSRRHSWTMSIWFVFNLLLALAATPLIPSVLRLNDWGPFLNYMSASQSVWSVIGPYWWAALPAGIVVSRICERIVMKWRLHIFTSPQEESTALGKPENPLRKSNRKAHLQTSTEKFRPILPLLFCSILPLVFLALATMTDLSSLANPRYRIATAPASALLISLLLTRSVSRFSGVLGALILMIVAWCCSASTPWIAGRLGSRTDREWDELAADLNEHALPGSAILVGSGLVECRLIPAFLDDPLFLEYTAARISRFSVPGPFRRIGLSSAPGTSPELNQFYLNTLTNPEAVQHNGCWIASTIDTDLARNSVQDLRHLVARAGLKILYERQWQGAILLHISPPEKD
ncbi:MAG TPA: hypothetical protein VNQ76_01390 [Planctomicrobium sp.]|nr:hypothetical protein [Planctomicrobium sp.]